MDNPFDDIELEPEAEAVREGELLPARFAIESSLPTDFNLRTLLTFLPDPRLKQKLDVLAVRALGVGIEGQGHDGLRQADTALSDIRTSIKEIKACFAEPTSMANSLHKRLTGLASDFVKNGEQALDVVGRRVIAENRRLDALAAEKRRQEQEHANEEARKSAAKVADEAKLMGMPKEVVVEMAEAAKTATAPPVAAAPRPAMATTAVGEKWRARLIGTAAEAEPHPSVKDLTEAQRASAIELCKAIGDGSAPLAAIKEFDWGYLDRRAASERTTLIVPGLEAFDEGKVGAKPQRGRR